eukprot:520173_1
MMSSSNEQQHTDFEIFQQILGKCNATSLSIKEGCPFTMRIIFALLYYRTLKLETVDHKQINTVKHDQEKLLLFYKKTYKHLLDDFVHIVSNHRNDFDKIYELAVFDKSFNFGVCNVLSCKLSQRHNRDRKRDKQCKVYANITDDVESKTENDIEENSVHDEHDEHDDDYDYDDSDDDWFAFEPYIAADYTDDEHDPQEYHDLGKSDFELEFNFIRDLFDGIHCYIFHGYDFGFRIHNKDKQKFLENSRNDVDKLDHSCNNIAYEYISKIIKEKKKILGQGQFPRFSNHSKYNINQITSANGNVYDSQDESITFMDQLIKQMNQTVNFVQVMKAYTFFEDQEYDTEAIEEDIMNQVIGDDNLIESNIFICFDKHICNSIRQYVATKKLFSASLLTGFTFYYWSHYKQIKTCIKTSNNADSMMDYGGYNPQELF